MRIQRAWILPGLTLVAAVGAAPIVQAQTYPNPSAQNGPALAAQFAQQGATYYPGSQSVPVQAASGYATAFYPPSAYAPGGYFPAAYYPGAQQYPVPSPAEGGYVAAAYAPNAQEAGAYYATPVQYAAPQAFQPGAAATPMPDPYSASFAGYSEPVDAGQPCPSCGGSGCEQCRPECRDFDFRLLRCLLPYADGGSCAPRWYDIQAEFVGLKRDDLCRRGDFTSLGPRGLGPPDIILSTDNLDFPHEAGFRVSTAVQFFRGTILEFSYLGTFDWHSRVVRTSEEDELYSVFSDYGTNPPPSAGPPIVRGGYPDTDSADLHGIEYSSGIDSFELFCRRRWAGPNCRLQGSWLAGVRYVMLDERFRHFTHVDYQDPNQPLNPNARITGSLHYLVDTYNSLTGFQAGGDLWACVIPGLMVGSELKAGIYGNRADQGTVITADHLAQPVIENVRHADVSFVGELNAMFLYRVSYNWTLRGGYQALFLDGVALAPENFNPYPPFQTGRTPFLEDDGHVLAHGFSLGLEWLW